jgi:S-(hydroxymethyl)glutathione dehydrogenase/alcohol dehydrogenase
MGSNDFKVDVPRYMEMYRDGRLDLGDMITERIRLDEINDGFEAMVAGRSPRVLVEIG